MNKAKKKIKPIIWVITASIVVVIGLIGIIYNININKTLDAPKNLYITTLSNNKVYLNFDKVSGAEIYKYKITGTDTNILISKINEIDISAFVENTGEYFVEVRAIGKTLNSSSEYAKIDYCTKTKISTPNISNTSNNSVNFELCDAYVDEVKLTFKLYYQELGNDNFKFITLSKSNQSYGILKSNNHGHDQGSFNLDFLSEGTYNMYLSVFSNSYLYTNSAVTPIFEFTKTN